jgi:hypothetical protein
VYSFYLSLALPLIPFAIGFAFTGLAWGWSFVPILRQNSGVTIAGRKWRLGFMCENGTEVYKYLLTWLEFAVPFLNINYNSLCIKCFDTFLCSRLADGAYFLNAAPDVACWDNSEHQAMVGVSILGLVAYVLGIPAYVLATMLYALFNRSVLQWLHIEGLRVAIGTPSTKISSKSPRSSKSLAFCTLDSVLFLFEAFDRGACSSGSRRLGARVQNRPTSCGNWCSCQGTSASAFA